MVATHPVLLLLAAILVTVLGAAPVPTAAQPQQVPPAGSPLRVVLDRVAPSTVTPDTEVVITGTVHNDGTEAVAVRAVRASTAYRGLDTRRLVSSWAAGTSGVVLTRDLGEDEVDAELAPGAALGFRISVEAGTVAPPFDFATLPLRLSVAGAGGEDLTELRTYLPWDGQTDYDHHPLATAVLVPLTLPADPALLTSDDATRTAAWERLAGPGSDLVQLVAGLADEPVTFLVDPALVATPSPPATLAPTPPEPGEPTEPGVPEPSHATEQPSVTATPDDDGVSATAPGDGTTATDGASATGAPPDGPGAGSDDRPAPADQVETLRSALLGLDARRLWWLPYGDPDLDALQDLGATDRLAPLLRDPVEVTTGEGSTTPTVPTDGDGTEAVLARGGSGIVWPLWDAPDDTRLTGLVEAWSAAGSGLTAVVVPSSTVAGQSLLTPTAAARHTSGVPLLGYDERLSGLVTAAGPADQHGAALQRLLAETLAVYQEQPATDRELLLALPRGHDTDPAVLTDLLRTLEEAPWLRATGVDELLTRTTRAEPVGLTPPAEEEPDPDVGPGLTAYPEPGAPALTAARLQSLSRTRAALSGAGELVPRGAVLAGAWDRVLDQALSTRWREDARAWAAPVQEARDAAREVLQGVRINPTTINFLADEGLIQLTVSNDLPVEVSNLRITLTPGNPRLRVVEQPEPVTVGPGSRATVQFRARALAAGEVEVRTTMTTPDGTPVGRPEVMQVRVQPTGAWIYWVLGSVAGIILVLGLWRALRPRKDGGATQTTTPEERE